MKTLFVVSMLAMSTSAFSAVVKSYDTKNSCTIYKAVTNEDNGKPVLKTGETVVFDRNIYGFVLKDLEIDFDARKASTDISLSVVVGFNRPLFKTKAIIQESNPKFTEIVNQLNRKLAEIESICLNAENEIIYTTMRK